QTVPLVRGIVAALVAAELETVLEELAQRPCAGDGQLHPVGRVRLDSRGVLAMPETTGDRRHPLEDRGPRPYPLDQESALDPPGGLRVVGIAEPPGGDGVLSLGKIVKGEAPQRVGEHRAAEPLDRDAGP